MIITDSFDFGMFDHAEVLEKEKSFSIRCWAVNEAAAKGIAQSAGNDFLPLISNEIVRLSFIKALEINIPECHIPITLQTGQTLLIGQRKHFHYPIRWWIAVIE